MEKIHFQVLSESLVAFWDGGDCQHNMLQLLV